MKSVLLALALATLPGPLVGQEFDHSAYESSSIRTALKRAGINPAMNYWFDASHPKIRTVATFTGTTRPIHPKSAALIKHWGVAMGHAREATNIFDHEIQVKQFGKLYWMPIQRVLQPAFADEVEAGQKVALSLLLIGAYDGVPVFTIAAFGPPKS